MTRKKFIKKANQSYKAVSKTDFHLAYGCSPYTFRQWIKGIGELLGTYRGGLYTPRQVALIVEHLGKPPQIEYIIYER